MIPFYSKSSSSFLVSLVQKTLALAILSFALTAPANAAGQSVRVTVDQARIMRLQTEASTIIVGNPMIADVTIQDNKILVVMGKSNGLTNMIALDDKGNEVANISLIVQSNAATSVTLYKGSSRVSMNCAPNCERSLNVGDAPPEFELVEKQLTKKMAVAKNAATFAN